MKSRNLLWLMVLTVIMVFAAGNAYSAAVELPQTGQTTSYVAGDDGDLQMGAAWPSPRFTNPDGSTPIAGDVVVDQLTGLMWMKDPALGGNGTWKTVMENINGLNGGAGTYGYTDWRMPNLNEFESLMNYEEADTAAWLNSQGFLNVQSWSYYVSTSYQGYLEAVWMIDLRDGTTGFLHPGGTGSGRSYINLSNFPEFASEPPYAWPVRDSGGTGVVDLPVTGETFCVYEAGGSPPANWGLDPDCTASGTGNWGPVVIEDGALQKGIAFPSTGNSPDGRFDNNFNGTITDLLTDLQWTRSGSVYCDAKKTGNGHIENFQDALDFISDMNNGTNLSGLCASPCENYGYTGWRLPNKKEMYTLIRHVETGDGYLLGQGFVNVNNTECSPASLDSLYPGYWTSTTYPVDTASAYSVQISHGLALDYSKTNSGTVPGWNTDPVPLYMWPVRDVTTAPYGIGVGIEPAGTGSVTGTGFNCPGDCSEVYLTGATGIVLTATPLPGSQFDYWSGCDDDVSQAPDCVMDAMGRTKSVTAYFKKPDERIVPMALVFGAVDVGLAVQRTVTISNYEFTPYDFGAIPAPSSPFSIVVDTCSNQTLDPVIDHDSQFTTGIGRFKTNLGNTLSSITYFLDNPVVEGSTKLWYRTQPGGKTVSDIAGVYYYDFSDPYGIDGTINYATGEVYLTFTNPVSGGPPPGGPNWIQSGYVQGPMGTCDITVEFAPTSAGSFKGTVDIPSLKSIALWGEGVSAPGSNPDIAVSTVDVSFMNTHIGKTSTKSITVWNDGTANLVITSVSGPANEFSIASEDCTTNSPIDPSGAETCTIDIMYTAPGTPGGVHFSTLQIQSDDPDENPVVVNLSGSAMVMGDNTPPTRPVLISPLNGAAMSTLAPLFTYNDAEDVDICTAPGVPSGCDDTQTLTNTLYLASDPGFQNLLAPVANLNSSNVSYAMLLGNPVFMIALFGLVAIGVFLRRKKIALIIIAVMFTGLLLAACGNHKSDDTGGEGSGAVQAQAGKTYYWKVIADDGQGGTAESETWSFTTGQ